MPSVGMCDISRCFLCLSQVCRKGISTERVQLDNHLLRSDTESEDAFNFIVQDASENMCNTFFGQRMSSSALSRKFLVGPDNGQVLEAFHLLK
jgi:hypothetical protein